jgi:hypothetical protein
MIRALDPQADAEAVLDHYRRAADYLNFESGRTPDEVLVSDYIADAPTKGDPTTSLKLGLLDGGRLLGIVDIASGYPEAQGAYPGLMLLARVARVCGPDRSFLRHVENASRKRGTTRLLLVLLEANPRCLAF